MIYGLNKQTKKKKVDREQSFKSSFMAVISWCILLFHLQMINVLF